MNENVRNIEANNDKNAKLEKLLSLSKEEIDKIISGLSLDELETLLSKMSEVND